MSAFKDPKTNKWFCMFRYKDWTGKSKVTTKRGFPTRREALEWENSFKVKLAGTLDMSMKDFIDLYVDERFPRLKEVTRSMKMYIINDKILPYFGKMTVNKITTKDVIKWQNALISCKDKDGRHFAKSYLKTIHNQLNAILNYAVKYYSLPSNPASQVGNMGSESEIDIDFWTTEEYLKFSEEMMAYPEFYYYFQVLYWLGLREGEALALTQDDFNFKNKTVSVTKTRQVVRGQQIITPPKTPKSNRIVTIPDFLCDELKEYFEMLPELNTNDMIFYMLNKYSIEKKMAKVAKLVGVKQIRVHDLRHSHVSLLINMGYSAVAIANRMGHESVHVTYRYAHLFPSIQSDMANSLNDLMRGGTP